MYIADDFHFQLTLPHWKVEFVESITIKNEKKLINFQVDI